MNFAWGLFAAAVIAAPASAGTTLTFEGQQNATYDAPITLGGFVIGNPSGQEQHFHQITSTAYGLPSNGTGVLLNDRDTQISITAVGGGSFLLSSFDIAAAFGNSPASGYAVTGYRGANVVGTLSGAFGASYSTLPGFGSSLLDRVVFDGIGDGGGFVLDNVVLNDAVPSVPEPATWAMMLVGFGVVGAAMRRCRQVARVTFA